MEAKDTVMSYKSIEEMQHTTDAKWVDKGRNIAETQAEISFKAGKQEERREVARWINTWLACCEAWPKSHNPRKELRAKLKEWENDV